MTLHRTISLALTLGILPGRANAIECFTADEAPPDAGCVVQPRGAVRGIWFSLHEAERFRQAALLLPELHEQIDAFEESLDVRAEQVREYRIGIKQQGLALNAALKAQAATAGQLERALEEAQGWTSSPTLWFAGGVVVTIAGVVLVGVATK